MPKNEFYKEWAEISASPADGTAIRWHSGSIGGPSTGRAYSVAAIRRIRCRSSDRRLSRLTL